MTITLRLYHPNDFESVVQLWHQSWYHSWHRDFPGLRHSWTYEEWQERFQQKVMSNESIWVAESGDQIVGFIALRESDGYLDQIFVAPEIQHQGVGTILMHKAKELSPNGIYLETLQCNTNARRFYKRHGFLPGQTGINPNNGQANIEYRWTPQAARIS